VRPVYFGSWVETLVNRPVIAGPSKIAPAITAIAIRPIKIAYSTADAPEGELIKLENFAFKF
jgi:hypothetical protein